MQLQSLFITPVMMTEVKGHSHLIDRLYELKAKDENPKLQTLRKVVLNKK